jgi:heme/copper-type cytochrome/quinol oxidase subunit 3
MKNLKIADKLMLGFSLLILMFILNVILTWNFIHAASAHLEANRLDDAQALLQQAMSVIFISSSLAVFMGILIAFVTTRSITKPLSKENAG